MSNLPQKEIPQRQPSDFYETFKKRRLVCTRRGINMDKFEFSAIVNGIHCVDCDSWIRDQSSRAILTHISINGEEQKANKKILKRILWIILNEIILVYQHKWLYIFPENYLSHCKKR